MPSLKQTIKQLIKHNLQHLAARFGRHTRKPDSPELLILMYHRVLPSDDSRATLEEPGMMVTPATFRLHMTQIKALFEVIHLSQWLELKASGNPLPDRCCVITFDDGWADNYQFAYPILREMKLPATIFLVSDMIGTNTTFWPERLAGLLAHLAQQPENWSDPGLQWIRDLPVSFPPETMTETPPDQEKISEIIAAAKSFNDSEIHQRLDLIEKNLQFSNDPTENALLNWQQVTEMCQDGLIEIGSHTCHHTRLNNHLSPTQIKHEVANSKHQIEQQIKQPVKSFCYPNGDYCQDAIEQVKKYYNGAVTTQTGWNNSSSDPWQLKRIGLHEDISNTQTRFLACISGWL